MNLKTSVGELPFVGAIYEKRLKKLGIKTLEDLLLHIPHRYEDFRHTVKIRDIKVGEIVTIKAELVSIKNVYTKSRKVMQEALIKDSTGQLAVTWFNQPFLVRTLKEGDLLALSGKINFWGNKIALVSPVYENIRLSIGTHTGRLVPIYPETSGLSSKWLRREIAIAFEQTKGKWEEFLPSSLLKKIDLPNFESAISWAHFPKVPENYLKAKKRLAFNELLFLQMNSLKKKENWKKSKVNHKLVVKKDLLDKFTKSLPFKLTNSQKTSIDEIISDLKNDFPMNRLLEGDVGSGKTVVAAFAIYLAFVNGYQSAFIGQ